MNLVCLGYFVPLENFSFIWRRHHCRLRAGNYYLWLAFTAIEQWGLNFYLCTVFLIEMWILFTSKPCLKHTEWEWSLYCLVCFWYANFIEMKKRPDSVEEVLMFALWSLESKMFIKWSRHKIWIQYSFCG